jgi:hypothetical protein
VPSNGNAKQSLSALNMVCGGLMHAGYTFKREEAWVIPMETAQDYTRALGPEKQSIFIAASARRITAQ